MRITIAEFERLKRKVNKKNTQKHKEKKEATFVLPWPPTVNKMYATTQNGKRVLSKKAVQFYKDCKSYLTVQNVPAFHDKTKMLVEYFPDRGGRWDESNFKKATEDTLVKNQIIPDDSVKYLQPLASVIHKKIDKKFIRVTLKEI